MKRSKLMKIEAGKAYLTRSGQKAYVGERQKGPFFSGFIQENGNLRSWFEDGSNNLFSDTPTPDDLIEETGD